MSLSKAPVNIYFDKGLETKSDPFKIPVGNFLGLENSVFDKGNLLKKRNGFGALTPITSDTTSTLLTTFNNGLVAIGDTLQSYSQGTQAWSDKGPRKAVSLDVLPLIRNSTNQSQADTAISPNGLVCTVFTDNVTSGSTTVAAYKYAIADVETGQNIIAPTVIPVNTGVVTGSPRIFLLGSYFIIVFTNNISGTFHLQYVAININVPTSVTANASISSDYTPSSSVNFDGVVANNSLYLAWNGNDVGGAVRMKLLTSTLSQSNVVIFATSVATIMSVTSDNTVPTPIIYVSFYDSATDDGYTLAVDSMLNTVLAPTQTINNIDVLNLSTSAQNGSCLIYYEVNNAYSYDNAIKTNYVAYRTISQAGVLGTPGIIARSVGLASKAFLIEGVSYVLTAYSSAFQPSYFLINQSGEIVAKLAYSNGYGYLATGTPSVDVDGTIASIAYVVKSSVQAISKEQDAVNSQSGVYSQTGVNLASFDIGNANDVTSEIGSNLHLTGGFLWAYDGYLPVEQGFHVWPDNVELTPSTGGGSMEPQEYFYQVTYEWSDNQGNLFRSAPSIPVSATAVAAVDNTFADTDVDTVDDEVTITNHGYSTGTVFTLSTGGTLPSPLVAATNYYVIRVDANTIKIASSLAFALAGTPINLGTTGTGTFNVTVGTDQNSVTINIPTLRLTYKVSNPVKIVIYRWSTAQQVYYQVTSIAIPLLNNTAIDSVSYVDTLPDASILGNTIIYTTGGVLENIPPPAVDSMTLWQSRLVVINAESKDQLLYSKQVIPNTPVEMSDLLSINISSTTSSQGSTGPIRCIAPMDDKLVIFKDSAILYTTGAGPDNTGANSQISEPVLVTSTVGSNNQQSIVFMPNGLMFQSNKGIWLLGRDLSTSYIGAPVEALTQDAIVLSAVNVPGTNQIRFTMDSGITLMYDYFYGQWGTFTNVPAISSTLFDNRHTYLDVRGRVFTETPGRYLDGSQPVLMSFRTGWIALGGLQGFERIYEMYFLGTYLSPHKLICQIGYDYNSSPLQSTTVTPDNFSPNWGGETLWGGGGPWGGISLEQWRVFFNRQKCQSFQITMQEVYDPSFGVTAGAGFTMSGIDLIVGLKDGKPRLRGSRQTG